MRIGIIGAGFTGLAAGLTLSKEGHSVHIFEKDPSPGGLAIGYQEKGWDWTLEKHYHHWFANDQDVLSLAAEIGHPVIKRRPRTAVYVPNDIYQLDSPFNVLRFPRLSLPDRLRMAGVLGFLKFDPFWKPLERVNAADVLPTFMGKRAYEMIWEPQFLHKFGSYAKDVSLAWFWARIVKRTSSLVYPEKGFLNFAQDLTKKITDYHGNVLFETETVKITERGEEVAVDVIDKKGQKTTHAFDRVIVTLPSFLFQKLTPDLPQQYKDSLAKLKGIGAINLVLRLKEPFFKDNTYWLSVCDPKADVTAIVEHTNFMDKSHYNNEHLVYVGNYLAPDHPFFSMDEKTLLATYHPFLSRVSPAYEKQLIGTKVFKAPFAQPIIPINYSRLIPPHTTPLKHVFLANIEQVYPWDRGTNYAVQLGRKVAGLASRS